MARAGIVDDPAAVFSWAAAIESLPDGKGAVEAPGTSFVVRRIANPRWRPPAPASAMPQPAAAGLPRALDHVAAQLSGSEAPSADPSTHWEMAAGEQGPGEEVTELFAAGTRARGQDVIEGLRLSLRHEALSGALGDQVPLKLGPLVSLQRLRGASLGRGALETGWTALAGVPTPVPGQPRPRLRVAGLGARGLRSAGTVLSFAAAAFSRGSEDGAPDGGPSGGRGGLGTLEARRPLGGGMLLAALGAQMHDLGGRPALGGGEALSWEITSRRLAAALSSARSTRDLRVLGTDRISTAPQAEDRWSLQGRSAGGRAETHLSGVLRRGGEESLEARTIGAGVSGSLGRSAWYGGADAVWDDRPALVERRFSVQAGRGLSGGRAFLARLECIAEPGAAAALAAVAEASFPFRGGVRLEMEPRVRADDRALQDGQLTARLGGPLGPVVRLTGGVAVGADRDRRFRGVVREATVALSCAPRSRERGDLEIRRLDESGPPALQYWARYDATVPRYEAPAAWGAARDSGFVTVIVGRSGNASGVPDVLVSLDGQSLRFTDADGVARFDQVPPGVHTVAVEERSLEAGSEVVGTSRLFITVESGRPTEPARFTVGRRERRTDF